MNTTRSDESPETTAWLGRIVIPASAWALLFAFFAFAGWASQHEPRQMATSISTIEDTRTQLTMAPRVDRTPAADVSDSGPTELEVLDPVGAGH